MIHCLKKFHSKVVWPTVWSQRELQLEEGKAKKCIFNLKTSLRWTLKASEALSTLLSKAKPSHIYSIIKLNVYLLRLVPSSCVHYHTYYLPANRVLPIHFYIKKKIRNLKFSISYNFIYQGKKEVGRTHHTIWHKLVSFL